MPRRGGMTLAGTPADIQAKKLAAEKRKAEASKEKFTNFNFDGNCNTHNLKDLKSISTVEISQIAFEQGKTNFNAKEYADKANEKEKKVDFLNSLSKKDQKKAKKALGKGGKNAASIRAVNSKKNADLATDKDAAIIKRLKSMSEIKESIIDDYLRLSTENGVVSFLIEAIKMGLKSDPDNIVPHMYLELSVLNCPDFKTQIENVMKRVNSTLKMTVESWIQTQMTDMSCYLPPLNKFSRREKKLDDWQKHIMKSIDENKNVILVAKTSAGKTVCSTYVVFKATKVLYVLPSTELAEQVFGLIHNQLGGRTMMVTNRDVFHMNDNVKVIVGTPYALENFLAYNPELKFDYTVYDEVHGLNGREGDSLENLIKTVDGNFLALSATVENPDDLAEWWKSIKPEIEKPELVLHDSRFIVQQRYLWHNKDNSIESLNPLSSIDDLNYIKEGGMMKGTLSFTSRDTFNLWLKLKDSCPELSPYKFFSDRGIVRLSLDDSKEYEKFLKTNLQELATSKPVLVKSIIDSYQTDYKPGTEDQLNIYKLIQTLYSKKMIPALCFQLDQDKVHKTFYDLIKYLEDGEKLKYPYFKNDNIMQSMAYEDYCKIRDAKLENLKIPKGENPADFKSNISKEINEDYLSKFQIKYNELTVKRHSDIEANNDFSPEMKKHHHKYCDKKLREVMNMRSLNYTNPYQAHPEFSFNPGLIDDNAMRIIKRRLSQQLGLNLSYDHPIMRAIEMGFSMYVDSMPLPFQRVIKGLFCDKKLTVLFSDETLAYGVNFPVRSVALIGNNIDPLVAQQMAGRAGRRGKDNQGHVIYVDSCWKNILRGTLPKIVGNNSNNPYNVLRMNFLDHKSDQIEPLYKQTLSNFIDQKPFESKLEEVQSTFSDYLQKENEVCSKLIWNLRRIKNAILIPSYLEYIIEKYQDVKQDQLFMSSKNLIAELVTLFDIDSEEEQFEPNIDLVQLTQNVGERFGIEITLKPKSKVLVTSYSENRIIHKNVINIVSRFKRISNIIQEIQKVILKTKYDKGKKMLEFAFGQIKQLTNKYQDTGNK
jgi:hypothetical protein